MGLAPYGKPIYQEKIINNLIDIKEDGTFRLDQSYFNYATGLTMTNEKFHNLFGQEPRNPKKNSLCSNWCPEECTTRSKLSSFDKSLPYFKKPLSPACNIGTIPK